MLTGYVCLIGAGPGDPGLITLKGLEYLRRAEVLLYDHLIPGTLLLETRRECERICVGKAGGEPSISQAEINRMLIDKAKAGRFVVRLKGGDPFLFGRGGEEVQALREAGVPFLVIPGVSSSYAVPAYAGIPVTDRRVCSGVEISTGHQTNGEARAHTQVVLMALHNLGVITDDLMRRGYPGETPACLISQGTTPGQKTVTGSLATIVSLAEHNPLGTPVLLVAGETVRFQETLDWRKKSAFSR